ncbi:MAG: helix-turn-helix transcriptional regulator [Myxococcales bacterium]|nr:helix-turn-helix transcriptional regulator [Myxococcales bacterium]
MTRPGERWAQSFMIWAATGACPAWRPLAVARRNDALVVAVEWGTWPHDERPYGVVEIALSGDSLRWQSFQIGEKERMLKLVSGGESADGLALSFGDLLRYHREQAGLTRMELAAQTGLAYQGIVQIEKGGSTPSLQTLRLLRKVEALRPFLQAVGTPTYRTGLRSVRSDSSALSVNGEGP